VPFSLREILTHTLVPAPQENDQRPLTKWSAEDVASWSFCFPKKPIFSNKTPLFVY
jgi:hypothetical protein